MSNADPPINARPSPTRLRLWVALALYLVALGAGVWYLCTRTDDSVDADRNRQENKDGVRPTVSRPDGGGAENKNGKPWFQDRTADSGIQFTYRNGEEADEYTLLETLGGGVALFDYDGDGLLDIFVTGGGYFEGKNIRGYPCRLYKNLGNWKFKDVTREAGLDVDWWYTHGVAVADYDRDGWPDFVVTGYGRIALFHNVSDGKGGRRFVDVSKQVGLKDDLWSTSAGWADLDGDGYPELYVCHYADWSFTNHPPCPGQSADVKREICGPIRFKPLVHALFRNNQGKSFTNIAAEQGFRPEGCGLGVVLADLNDDGRPDIYVANDIANNFCYFNRGPGKKLDEQGLAAGVAVDDGGNPNGSMGVDVGDYDGSGRPSLFVTNFERELHALYRNFGKEAFYYQSHSTGMAALGKSYVGFGTGFVDVDNDGWEDLVIANGHVFRRPARAPVKQRPILLRNVEVRGQRYFVDAGERGGAYFQTPTMGRGLAVGDLDNDGWPDLVISHTGAPVTLLRNDAALASAPPNRWLGFQLAGKDSRDLVGSTVIVELDDGNRRLTRFVKGGGSYLSASDPRILFGLGSSVKVKRVTVRWSWGKYQTWDSVEPGAYWELQENQPQARRISAP